MRGQMQDWPLLCQRVVDHAATQHGGREVVSRSVEGPLHRTNYREMRARALRVAQRLERDGIKFGDRVATMAWNTWRHLEAWFGIAGAGAVCHTVNHLVNARMNKRRQMRWPPQGAHRVLQVRAAVLDGRFGQTVAVWLIGHGQQVRSNFAALAMPVRSPRSSPAPPPARPTG